MSELSSALNQVGVGTPGASSLGQAIDQFNAQNLSPTMLSGISSVLKNAVESAIPTILRLPPTAGAIEFQPASGEWVSVHYADDLIDHAPKFKFLFKVTFIGFGEQEFQYYVHRCDKPKVTMNHADVNFYNFRSRVLTSVVYQPLSMSLLDETGNSVNAFFVSYMNKVSGTGSGNWGVDSGFGGASSSKPYEGNRGYSVGQRVIIEQVFANGQYSNLFELINPRIENFDFDELNMEDSSSGSMLNLSISYDALECKTVKLHDSYTWGNTDLRKGGGTSGFPNAGASSVYVDGVPVFQSANGAGINGISPITPTNSYWEAAISGAKAGLPPALQGLGNEAGQIATSLKDRVSSAGDTLSRNVSETFEAVKNGLNFSRPNNEINS